MWPLSVHNPKGGERRTFFLKVSGNRKTLLGRLDPASVRRSLFPELGCCLSLWRPRDRLSRAHGMQGPRARRATSLLSHETRTPHSITWCAAVPSSTTVLHHVACSVLHASRSGGDSCRSQLGLTPAPPPLEAGGQGPVPQGQRSNRALGPARPGGKRGQPAYLGYWLRRTKGPPRGLLR